MKHANLILLALGIFIAGIAGCSFSTDFDPKEDETDPGAEIDTLTDNGIDTETDTSDLVDTATETVNTCDGCFIGSVCIPDGFPNPANECHICDASANAEDWSNNDGKACNDTLFCTNDDTCQAGVCSGTEDWCDDGVACDGVETCDETANTCVDGTTTCVGGQVCDWSNDECITSCPVTDCEISDTCHDDGAINTADPCQVCDLATSSTTWTAGNAGAVCDDNDNCTDADRCGGGAAGTCGGTAKDCTEFEDDCKSAACNGSTGICDTTNINEGGVCDDGDDCLDGETCTAGVCGGSTPVDCSDDDGQCTVGTCNPVNGGCYAAPENDSDDCSDSDNCNTGELCQAGTCSGGSPVDCTGSDGQCVVGTCDPADGTCSGAPANEGNGCADGNDCTSDETCQTGLCLPSNKGYVFYDDFSDNSASWTLGTEWSISATTGGGTCDHGTNPVADHTVGTTDDGVAGVSIDGCMDLTEVHTVYCLESPAMDTVALGTAHLTYWRWIGAEDDTNMQHTVEVWDGSVWQVEESITALTEDAAWTFRTINILTHVNGAMKVRFCHAITDFASAQTVSSWNIDDVTIGAVSCTPPAVFCGNEVVDGTDECDAADLDGEDCTTMPGSFTGGTLDCNPDCTFDVSGCS